MKLDFQRLALDPQRRIMDDAVLGAVERVHEGMERRVVVDGDLAGVGIGPLGDHGAVGEDIDLEGANIAGFIKVANAMVDQGLV